MRAKVRCLYGGVLPYFRAHAIQKSTSRRRDFCACLVGDTGDTLHALNSLISIFLLWLRRSYECCTIHISGRRMKPMQISPVTCQVASLPRSWCAAVAKQSGTQSTGRIWCQKSRFKWRKFEKLHLYHIIYVRNSAFRLRNERWRKKVWPLALLEHETMHFRMNFFEMSQIASMFDSFSCCTSMYYMHFMFSGSVKSCFLLLQFQVQTQGGNSAAAPIP